MFLFLIQLLFIILGTSFVNVVFPWGNYKKSGKLPFEMLSWLQQAIRLRQPNGSARSSARFSRKFAIRKFDFDNSAPPCTHITPSEINIFFFQWNSSMLDADNLRMSYHQKSSPDWSDPGLFKYVTCLVANISFFYFRKQRKVSRRIFPKRREKTRKTISYRL